MIKIKLEDKGQDFTVIVTDDNGVVIDAQPFQAGLWQGAIVPVHEKSLFREGERLPIHHPPYIEYGYLKYRIEKIEHINT